MRTIDGADLFRFHTQEGFTLASSLMLASETDTAILWAGWFKAARTENKRSGAWDFDKACDAIESALADCSGWPQTMKEILKSAWEEAVTHLLCTCPDQNCKLHSLNQPNGLSKGI